MKRETTPNGTLLNWSVKYLSPELSLGAIETVGFPESAALSGVVLIKLNYVGGNQRQITVAAHCARRCKAITQTRLWQPPCLFTDDQRQGRLAVSPSSCVLITRAVEWDARDSQAAHLSSQAWSDLIIIIISWNMFQNVCLPPKSFTLFIISGNMR